jgi:Family of unknown function (DUF5681)
MSPVKAVEKQGSRVQKGRSGNPKGRPKGSRNSATLAAEVLLDGEAEALTRKAIEMALDGDTVALRLCLERFYPPHKDRSLSFALPPIRSARDAADISGAVAAALSNGDITLSEAVEIGKLIDSSVKAHQVAELNDRVARIDQVNDAELTRIIMNTRAAEVLPGPPAGSKQQLAFFIGRPSSDQPCFAKAPSAKTKASQYRATLVRSILEIRHSDV